MIPIWLIFFKLGWNYQLAKYRVHISSYPIFKAIYIGLYSADGDLSAPRFVVSLSCESRLAISASGDGDVERRQKMKQLLKKAVNLLEIMTRRMKI